MCCRKIWRAAKKTKNEFIFNVSIQAIYDLLFEILAILVYSLEHLSPQYKVTFFKQILRYFRNKYSLIPCWDTYGIIYLVRTGGFILWKFYKTDNSNVFCWRLTVTCNVSAGPRVSLPDAVPAAPDPRLPDGLGLHHHRRGRGALPHRPRPLHPDQGGWSNLVQWQLLQCLQLCIDVKTSCEKDELFHWE